MVTTPAGFVIPLNTADEGTTAIGIRRAMAVLLKQASPGVASPGRLGADHLAVSGSGSSMAYTVSGGGLVVVRDGDMGAYIVGLPETVTVPTTASDGVNPRIDRIYAHQPDPDMDGAGVDVDFVIDVAHGSPAATPVAPTIPVGAIELARKVIAPGATNTATGAAFTNIAPVTGLNVQSVTWETIEGRPTTFPPAAHSHSWDSITGKPSSFPPSSHSHSWGSITGKPSSFTPSGHTHNSSDITGLALPINTIAAGAFTSSVWNRQVTSSYRTAYITNAGNEPTELGHTASSERYKQDITPFEVTDEQVEILQLVTFRWIADPDHIEVGLIAERLVEAGLGWAVFYNDDGLPEGIHYERAWLALLPYVQRLGERVAALEEAS